MRKSASEVPKAAMRMIIPAAAAAVVILCASFSASAGPGIVMKSSPGALIQSIYIEGDSLRIDMAGDEQEGEGKLIYRLLDDKKVLLILDKSDSSYYEITPEDMSEIKEQIDKAVEMIKRVLEDIPEDRREETEPIIRGLIPPEYAGLLGMMEMETKVVKEQENVRIGDWLADMYSVYHDGRKVTEAWFGGVEQFGLESEDFQILRDFDEFLEIPAPGIVPGFLISEIGDENAVPLRIIEIGEEDSRVPLLDVEEFARVDIPPSAFSVPEGFTKQEIEF